MFPSRNGDICFCCVSIFPFPSRNQRLYSLVSQVISKPFSRVGGSTERMCFFSRYKITFLLKSNSLRIWLLDRRNFHTLNIRIFKWKEFVFLDFLIRNTEVE